MDLNDFNSPLPKPWLNPQLNNTYSSSIECVTLDTESLSTGGNPASGNYNPTITAGTSLSAITNASHAQYFRIGDNIYVSGSFRATVTGTSPLVSFDVTMPPGSTSALSDYRSAAASGGSSEVGFLPLVFRDIANSTSTILTVSMNTFSGANQGAGPFSPVYFNYSIMFQSGI